MVRKNSKNNNKKNEDDRKETPGEQALRVVLEAESKDDESEDDDDAKAKEAEARRKLKNALKMQRSRAKTSRLTMEAKAVAEEQEAKREKERLRKAAERERARKAQEDALALALAKAKKEAAEAETNLANARTRELDAAAKSSYVHREIASADGFASRANDAALERREERQLDLETSRQLGVYFDQLDEDQQARKRDQLERAEDQRQRAMLLEARLKLMSNADARKAQAKEQALLEAECEEHMDNDVREAAFTETRAVRPTPPYVLQYRYRTCISILFCVSLFLLATVLCSMYGLIPLLLIYCTQFFLSPSLRILQDGGRIHGDYRRRHRDCRVRIQLYFVLVTKRCLIHPLNSFQFPSRITVSQGNRCWFG